MSPSRRTQGERGGGACLRSLGSRGIAPVYGAGLPRAGSAVIATSIIPAPPVPMLGHVTSSYRSDALRRTFALALVRSGSRRIGETLYVRLDGRTVPVTVTEPVLFDKEGARRDG